MHAFSTSMAAQASGWELEGFKQHYGRATCVLSDRWPLGVEHLTTAMGVDNGEAKQSNDI